VFLAAGLVIATALALTNVYQLFTPVELPIADKPSCGTGKVMLVMAQAVPDAASVPCVASLPAGWTIGGVKVGRGEGRFWLDSDQAGEHAVDVTLKPPGACVLQGSHEVISDEAGMRRFERPEQLPPDLRAVRMYVTEGACVTYVFEFDGNTSASAIGVLDAALGFQPRTDLVAEVNDRSGLSLCGAGAPRCAGDDG